MTDEGIRLAAEIERRYPGTGVVVLSQYDDPDYVLSLLGAGTKGRAYLLKERVSDVEELCRRDPHGRPGRVGAGSRRWSIGSCRRAHVVPRRSTGSPRARPRCWRRWPAASPTVRSPTSSASGVRAVEKHINAIFLKLDLSEETAVHKRVVAVVTFLSEVG